MTDAPLPLEQTDPELAEHFRLIANRQHPTVRAVIMKIGDIRIFTKAGRVIRKTTERNAPCPCGSGKKFKKCHG